MTASSTPPEFRPITDETARDMVRAVSRLSKAIEKHNEREGERSDFAPAIRYAETIDPPRMPRNLSWHEKVREKKVSLPVATGWSLLGYAVIEVIQGMLAGRIHFW